MQLTLQTQLLPDPEQARKLAATVSAFNAAANWLAGEAFALRTANKVKLQQLYYPTLREKFGLSSQMAIRCIAEVCQAYSRDKSKRPRFRQFAAVPYDQRLMSFKGLDRVSLLTLEGRVIVPLVIGKYQRQRFSDKYGQCDLVRRKDGKWFLLVTVNVPDGAPRPRTDFIGVDLGVENLATDSDGERFSGEEVERTRQQRQRQRQQLQQAAEKRKARGVRPKKMRRKLRQVSGQEARFRRHTNHVISKQLVAKATDTDCAIALENLKGIRSRARFRHGQRAKMSGWSFFQLRAFIDYKAQMAGIPVVLVDPAYTSQTCSRCGHCEKANRPSQSQFRCRACGFEIHADINAARNIRARAAVSTPEVSERLQTESAFSTERAFSVAAD